MHQTLPGFPKVVAFRSTTCLVEVMDFGAESSGMTIIKAGLAAKLNYANVGALRADQGKWIAADNEFAAETFRQLCNFTDSRPNSSDGALWRSSGPVGYSKPQ